MACRCGELGDGLAEGIRLGIECQGRWLGRKGRKLGRGGIFRISQAGIAPTTEPVEDQIADFSCITDSVEDPEVHGGMPTVLGWVRILAGASASGGADHQIGEAEQALEGALFHGDLLDIGEGERHFPDFPDAGTNA